MRVFNNSGDVNQGQGFVYGSSLILAYTQVGAVPVGMGEAGGGSVCTPELVCVRAPARACLRV